MYQHTILSRTMKSGDSYKKLKQMIQINIDAFSKFSKDISVFKLMEVDTYEIENEYYIKYHIALPKILERYYNGDIYSLIEDYYTEVGNVADVVRAGCITEGTSADAKMIVGHFDLITKFNEGGRLFDESDPRYVKAWKGALDRLTSGASGCISSSGCNSASSLDYGQLVFEINTGAMSRGYRTSPYPSREILIEIARRGIPVILSSDSHDVSTLMYGFDEAYHLAAECGARVLTSLFDQTCVCPAES